MIPSFDITLPTGIRFGHGKASESLLQIRDFGRHALWVTGSEPDRWSHLKRALEQLGTATTTWTTRGEPSVESVLSGAAAARESQCDFVVGIGGGSVVDTAKAIAALTPSEALEIFEYLEVVGNARPMQHQPLPWIAIPTTAGAGAECTRNAVLLSSRDRVKASLRSPAMLARLVIADPSLTLNLPRSVTAAAGFDALTQLIEPYLCLRANPFTDSLCQEAIPRALRALRQLHNNPEDVDARAEMMWAALCGGMALAHAGLGAVHGFAAPIGGHFNAPHGAVCAALLPGTIQVNHSALASRDPGNPVLTRFHDVARWITGNGTADIPQATKILRQEIVDWGVPRLSSYGIQRDSWPGMIAGALRSGSMKANPVTLNGNELREILELAG